MNLRLLLLVCILLVSCENINSPINTSNEIEPINSPRCVSNTFTSQTTCLKYPEFSKQFLSIIISSNNLDSNTVVYLTDSLRYGTVKEVNVMLEKYMYELAKDIQVTDQFVNNPLSVDQTAGYFQTFKIKR